MSLQVTYTLAVAPSDNALIASSQTNTAGQSLVFNTPDTDYIIPGNVTRRVSVGSTANISSATFTVIGINYFNQRISETITGINNNSVQTVNVYKSIERIINVNGVGPVFAGLGTFAITPPYVFDINRINSQFSAVQMRVISGTSPSYAVNASLAPFQRIRPGNLGNTGQGAIIAPDVRAAPTFVVPGLSGSTSTIVQLTQYYSMITADLNFTNNATAGSISMTVLQPGLV